MPTRFALPCTPVETRGAPAAWRARWLSLGLAATSLCAGACSNPDATTVIEPAPSVPGGSAPEENTRAEPGGPERADRFVLASISIDPDNNRVSYAQIVSDLTGHFDNSRALETPGNAVFLTHGGDFYHGLAESPEWVRYSTENGFAETGRLSFVNYGVEAMDYANVIVDDETAVSVLTRAAQAIVWDPTRMEVVGVIDLPHLVQPGFELEAFTTVAHGGLVYVPGKWVDWKEGDILQRVSVTILDPKTLSVVGEAQDDRCGAGGQVTFDARGYAYVMGDGRNQSMQVFAEARGEPVVHNCLLRIPPGQTDFDADYYVEIPSLTGGLDSMTEMLSATMDDGIGFSMMMYPDRISTELDRVNFEHWDQPAYRMWRIELGDTPRAEEVSGANFSVVGFSPSAVAGKLYNPESDDGSESRVYEIDPQANTATLKFTMAGYFAGLLPLAAAPSTP